MSTAPVYGGFKERQVITNGWTGSGEKRIIEAEKASWAGLRSNTIAYPIYFNAVVRVKAEASAAAISTGDGGSWGDARISASGAP